MRFVVLGLCLAALAGTAAAQNAPAPPPVLDQVYACAQVTGETERLACYDAAVGRLRQAQQSGELVAVDRQQADEIRRDSFGFSLPSLPRLFGNGEDAETASVSATIERVGQNGEGHAVFYLSNGQAWEQIESASISGLRSGVTVEVRRASLGSFLMYQEGRNRSYRVRRRE